ncbi:MAG: helix-turn-helix domain-containing protein [Halobacteriales archaeon]|nr:helix-turn-helix domain-containing protein [Halobacteriales archaeon]
MDEWFEQALTALTHEVRVDTLRTLADADQPLTFSELKARVDVVDSGRFNYHLNELLDQYLRETRQGYELNYRGKQIIIAAGGGVATDDELHAGADDHCPVCGDADCDRLIHVHLIPPTGV